MASSYYITSPRILQSTGWLFESESSIFPLLSGWFSSDIYARSKKTTINGSEIPLGPQSIKSLWFVILKGDHIEVSYNLVNFCNYRFDRLQRLIIHSFHANRHNLFEDIRHQGCDDY
jgi:hypothetical protein